MTPDTLGNLLTRIGKMDWKSWFGEVRSICWQTVGLDPNDLPDVDWRGFHEDEFTPLEAVREAMDEWGCDFGMDIGLLLR